MQPELKYLHTFLSALQPDYPPETEWCWQVIVEHKPVLQRHLTVDVAVPVLQGWNDLGADIFVNVAETDGTGRKASNIVRVRAVFVDLDGAPIEPVLAGDFKPHLIVNTSPGKYHAYWLTADVPLANFTPIQEALIAKYDGDKKVKDLCRVMRVPGFNHCKAEPRMVTCERLHDGKPYTLAELSAWLKPAKPVKYKPAPMPDHLPEEVTRILPTLVQLGLHIRDKGNGWHDITCPWAHRHTMGNGVAGYAEPNEKNNWKGAFHCPHSHCEGNKIRELSKFIELSLEKAHD